MILLSISPTFAADCKESMRSIIGEPSRYIWKKDIHKNKVAISNNLDQLIFISDKARQTQIKKINKKESLTFILKQDLSKGCEIRYKKNISKFNQIGSLARKLVENHSRVLFVSVSLKMPYSLTHLENIIKYKKTLNYNYTSFCDTNETKTYVEKTMGTTCSLQAPDVLRAAGLFNHFPSTLLVKNGKLMKTIVPGLVNSPKRLSKLFKL